MSAGLKSRRTEDAWSSGNLGSVGSTDEASIVWSEQRPVRKFEIPLGHSSIGLETEADDLPRWLTNAVRSLNEIAKLPQGWNSYSARPVNQRTIEHALNVLVQLMSESSPAPRIRPTSGGGVEFSWDSDDAELEVHVIGPFSVSAFFSGPNEEWERPIDNQVWILRPYIERFR